MGLVPSIGLANGTSGNAVVFAGATVIIALLALNVTGIPLLGLMGTVGAVSVAVAIAIATTLTPALLSIVGFRILSRSERADVPSAARTVAEVIVAENRVEALRIQIGRLDVVSLREGRSPFAEEMAVQGVRTRVGMHPEGAARGRWVEDQRGFS